MSIKEGTIVSPVSIEDVRTMLGLSTTDLGRLCTSAKIDKWCRNKPVRYPSLNETSRSVLGLGMEAYAGSGDSPEMVATADEGAYEWYYAKPTGGLSSPYRLTDFWGYQNNCRCPLEFQFPDKMYGDNASGILMEKDDDFSLPGGNVTFGEMFKISNYGTYRLSLAIVDTSGTAYAVKCWFFGIRIDGADRTLSHPDYNNVTVNTGILDYGLTNGKTYIGVLMLTDYPADSFDDIEMGVSAAQMNASGAKAVSLEPEAGINRFEFTYYKSMISETLWVRLRFSYCLFEKREAMAYGSHVSADIYNWNTFEGDVDWSTAKLIRNSCEIQVGLTVVSAHYAFDYSGNSDVPDTSAILYNRDYILDNWRDGKEYIILEPGYTEAEQKALYALTLTDFIKGYNIKVRNSAGMDTTTFCTAPVFFESNNQPPIGQDNTVYEARIWANIRRLGNSSTVVKLASDSFQVVAGNDHIYSYDE